MYFVLSSMFYFIVFIVYKKFFCKKYYIITYEKDKELKTEIKHRTESKDNKIINYYFSVKN